MATYGLGHPKNENILYNLHIIKTIKIELKKVRKSGAKEKKGETLRTARRKFQKETEITKFAYFLPRVVDATIFAASNP
jgi:hypothetical protein